MVSQESGDRELIALCLQGIGRVAGAQGNMEVAARLYGAGTAIHTAIGAPPSPAEHAQDAEFLQAVRLQLGETSFAAGWEEGSTMTLEQAAKYALGHVPAQSP